MKAIVAEIDKKQMIVITDKGDFVKIKRQMSAAIGDEIEFKSPGNNMAYKRLASIAACFMACIFLSTGVYAYYTPYSYVSVDINSSITMSLNRFERVISVAAITEDAEELINAAGSLKNQEIDKALSQIIKSASDKGYIDKNAENQVMVVVSAKDPRQEEKLAGTVNKAASKELSKVNKSSGITVAKTSVKSYKEAVSNKLSPGREILAGKLREVNPGIKDEEVKSMTVKEAVERINESRKAAREAEKDRKRAEKEQALKDKNMRNWKAGNKAEKAGAEEKKDDRMKPEFQPKDNKTGSGSKDNKSSPGKDNDKKGAGWSKNTDKNESKDNDKDSGKNNNSNKGDGSDRDKDKKGRTDEDDSRNKDNKSKWNSEGKSDKPNSGKPGQRIKNMMKTMKGWKKN